MNEYHYLAPLYDALLYPFVRRIRRDVLDIVLQLHPGKVLDVCCGTGDQLRLLKRHGLNAVGVDMSPAMVKVSRQGSHAPKCLLQDATAMTFADAAFDLAMISFALHEAGWHNAVKMMGEIHRVLSRDGHLLVVDYRFDGRSRPAQWMVTLIEFMAGRRHYRNFRTYRRCGGLDALIDAGRFARVREIRHAMGCIVIRLLQKRE